MAIITKEQIQGAVDSTSVVGEILVRNYQTALTKKGDEYITGTLLGGAEIQFKAWNNSAAFNMLKRNDYSNTPVQIMGKYNKYMDTMSIVLDSVTAVEGLTIDQFLPTKYNVDAYWNALQQIGKQKLSEFAYSILDKVLLSNKEVADRFKIEFAAMSHHDNCKSGLLAHTVKVVSNLNFMLTAYPNILRGTDEEKKSQTDLYFLGAILHDIGKVREMELGIYQPVSRVTHRYLGAEYIAEYKKEIVEHYDEEWYYNLMSVILQHHGEYAEHCATIYAYLVHKADMMDAELTTLVTLLENPVIHSSGEAIKVAEVGYLNL